MGRAGRDGRPARALLVLDKADYLKLRSLAHKGAAELAAVQELCARIFAPLEQLEQQVPGHRGQNFGRNAQQQEGRLF